MNPSIAMLDAIAGHAVNPENARSLTGALELYPAAGIAVPHRLAHFLAQVLHESGLLRYTIEIWVPTEAQKDYEGRADLGNTEPGDGSRFRGRGLVMCTGRGNAREFRDWCRTQGFNAPDFEALPESIAKTPWAGLTAVWFWSTHNLNQIADGTSSQIDPVEAITRKVNGGTNGIEDRRRLYTRSALVILGRAASDVMGFQRAAGLAVDGIAGPQTRLALSTALRALPAPSGPSPALAAWCSEGQELARQTAAWAARRPVT